MAVMKVNRHHVLLTIAENPKSGYTSTQLIYVCIYIVELVSMSPP